MLDDIALRAEKLMTRAKEHGVDLGNGDHMLVVVERLIDRLDKYKNETVPKPMIII